MDILAGKFDYCCRFNGGANAGHTIVAQGIKFAFHLLPSGMLYESVTNILGNGVVVNIPAMFKELEQLSKYNIPYDGRLLISNRAHIVTNLQLEADAKSEGDKKK